MEHVKVDRLMKENLAASGSAFCKERAFPVFNVEKQVWEQKRVETADLRLMFASQQCYPERYLTDDDYTDYGLERPKAVVQGNINPSDSNHKTWLEVPFADKEDAKVLGARWNPEKKKWFKTGSTQGLERWLPKDQQGVREFPVPSKNATGMTLASYLGSRGVGVKALSKKEAKLLGIPYPLRKGWADKHSKLRIDDALLHKLEQARGKIKREEPKKRTLMELFQTCETKETGGKSLNLAHPMLHTRYSKITQVMSLPLA